MHGIFYISYFFGLLPRAYGVAMPVYVHRTRKSPDLELKYEMCCVCAFSSHLFWTSNSLEVPAGATQDFSSTFLLRCVPLFFSRERFSRYFPSSTVKSNLCTNDLIVLHLLGIFSFYFLVRKNPSYRDSNSRHNVQKVTRLRTELSGKKERKGET